MKILVLNYSFDASAKQITFTDYNPIIQERILLATNVTDGIIIYNFANSATLGTCATNVLTLAYDTTTMSDTDKLQIFYDDANTPESISGFALDTTLTDGTQKTVLVDVGNNPVELEIILANMYGTQTNGAQLTQIVDAGYNSVNPATEDTLAAMNAKLVTGTDIGDVTINNAAGAAAVNIQDGGNTITVDGTVVVTNADMTTLAGMVVGGHGQVDVLTMPTVTVNAHAVTNAGTFAVQESGNVAHDSADSGNPVKIGGRASTTPVTAVAANDRVDAFFDVQGRQIVAQKALTGTLSNVNASASNVTLLAANAARLGATFYNDSTAILYLKLGATASATSFTVKMQPDDYYEMPYGYYGIVDGISASATGVIRVTEIT